MSKKILVTGCAGFIAARVVSMLLDQGCHVVGIDNMNDYYDVSLKQHRLDQVTSHPNFEFHELDIESTGGIGKLFDQHQFDAVLNLAARAGVRYSLENPAVYVQTNSLGNLNLLEAMRRTHVRKYVLASTSSLYAGQEPPFTEDLSGIYPLSPYAASKKSAELMAYSYHHLYGIDVSVCRYFTVYGPGSRPDMAVFRFIKWIDEGTPIELFGDGTQARDFTYVDDIARGTIASVRDVGYEIINLGRGNKPVSINELIETLEQILGKKAIVEHRQFHDADMKTTWADISKANRLLQWQPKVSLDEGLNQCVKWHREHQPWSGNILLP
ncbi:MAG: GDP-mannose 4,6-dehydratase [Mariniblastus sp.]|nr:GDP-mannose 4,6-dehydratase [Mariniblastus sp.]